jgi:hypothetical protein
MKETAEIDSLFIFLSKKVNLILFSCPVAITAHELINTPCGIH